MVEDRRPLTCDNPVVTTPRPRTVTILFTDQVGSTETDQRLSPEEALEARQHHLRLLASAAGDTGGEVVKNLGDGLMVAYESTTMAVAGAIAMQQSITAAQGRATTGAAGIRVGLSVGEATPIDGDWFGTPVVEAARLCALAEENQILANDAVRALVPRNTYSVVPLGLRDLKGLADPILVCEVPWEPAVGSQPVPAALAAGRTSTFVARDAELSSLLDAWARRTSGDRTSVFVAGEPGIGKTRLVAELGFLVAERDGAVVLFGRCTEEAITPYEPFVEALREEGHEFARLVPNEQDRAATQFDPGADVLSDRYLLFERVVGLLAELAGRGPVVLILDDLHWADASTLSLLRHLMRTSRSQLAMIVGTYRDTDLGRDHPLSNTMADLRRDRSHTRLLLRGLDEREVGALLEARAGHEVPEEFTRAVLAETDGNPFFVEETLLHLVEKGALQQHDGRWMSDATSIEELGIPEGIREVIGRRLSHLGEVSNQVLAAAAVLGREFPVAALELMTDLPSDAVLDAIDAASRAQMIVEAPGRPGTSAFAHALIREVLYEELSGARRQYLHQRAGAALEVVFAGDRDTHVAELARHFSELGYGGDVDKAIDYNLRAARQAMAQLARDEAMSHHRRALQVLELAGRLGGEQECAVLVDLLEASWWTGTSLKEQADRAIGLARATGDPRLFVRVVAAVPLFAEMGRVELEYLQEAAANIELADPGTAPRILDMLAHLMSNFPEFSEQECARAHERALESVRALQSPPELARYLWSRWNLLQHSPDAGQRQALIDEISRLANESEGGALIGAAWGLRLENALKSGDITQVRDELGRIRHTGPGNALALQQRQAAAVSACLALLEGRFADAEVLAHEMLNSGPRSPWDFTRFGLFIYAIRRDQGRLAELEQGLLAMLAGLDNRGANWTAPTESGLAALYVETDRLDEASAVVERIVESGRHRQPVAGVITLALLGESAAAIGDHATASEVYERMLPFDGQTVTVPWSYCNGAAARYLGVLAAALGDVAAADRHYTDALRLNSAMGARPWVARTELDLVRLRVATDNAPSPDAIALATSARDTAADLGMATLNSRAEAFLSNLAAR